MPDVDQGAQTRLIELGRMRFVLNGGTPLEYERLLRAIGHTIGTQMHGPMLVAKHGPGRWLVLGRDERSCRDVRACLEGAGMLVEVVSEPD